MADVLEMLQAFPPPLATDSSGVARVGGTRVRLESVIGAFQSGGSPEEILLKYPSLKLQDIYAVVTCYLWHQEEVEAYLTTRRAVEGETRRDVENRCPPQGIRERLLKRRETSG